MANVPEFSRTLAEQRQMLIGFIQNKIVFQQGNHPAYLAAKANFTAHNQEATEGLLQVSGHAYDIKLVLKSLTECLPFLYVKCWDMIDWTLGGS